MLKFWCDAVFDRHRVFRQAARSIGWAMGWMDGVGSRLHTRTNLEPATTPICRLASLLACSLRSGLGPKRRIFPVTTNGPRHSEQSGRPAMAALKLSENGSGAQRSSAAFRVAIGLPGARRRTGRRIGHERRPYDVAAALEAEPHRHPHAPSCACSRAGGSQHTRSAANRSTIELIGLSGAGRARQHMPLVPTIRRNRGRRTLPVAR
jgi:hypothetical protein